MIEPVAFNYNEQTASNNHFQKNDPVEPDKIQEMALSEFRNMVGILKEKDVNLYVVQDTLEPHTPDSIFPNNWISFHSDGRIAVYPMFAENRRLERRSDILNQMVKDKFVILDIADYTASEAENKFLEGTGSMVFDRENRVAYAAISKRTDAELFFRFCREFNFRPVSFHAHQTVNGERKPIYHTNVMMCIGTKFAVVCLDAIDDLDERKQVLESLTFTEKEVIEISEDQMHQFAGNMLQVEDNAGKHLLLMSQAAYDSLSSDQTDKLLKHVEIVSIPIPTIEKYGGGSVRCMIAEVFIPRNV
ncbi:amidinotransferase [Dysgonomonas sp. 520]|nr:amidinotransferase [Dysgonomonas sp. 520]